MQTATESTRKRSHSKAKAKPKTPIKKTTTRTKRISIDEAEEQKLAAIEEAVAKAKEEFQLEQEEEESHRSFGFNLNGDEYEEEEEEDNRHFSSPAQYFSSPENDGEGDFDIFQYVQKKFEDQGTPVLFYVKKDNEYAGQLPSPCDWSILQKQWGGGIYRVEARNALTKTYLKSQTARVAPPVENKKEDREERIIVQQPTAPTTPPVDMNQMFTGMMGMFQQMQEMNEKARTREERDDKKSTDGFNTTFLTIMQNQQQSTQQMFMEMQKNTQEMMRSISDNFSKSQEKIEDKTSRMFEKLADSQKDKEKIGTFEMIKLMNESRSDGISTMQTVMELAETMSASRGGDGEGDSKESLLASLVKGFMPILGAANRSMQANSPYAGGQPQQRGSVQGQVPTGIAQAPSQARTQNQVAGGAPQARPANSGAQTNAGNQGHRQTLTASALGLPSFTDTSSVKAESIIAEPQITDIDFVEKEEISGKDNIRTEGIYDQASLAQKTMAELAIPTIAVYLNDATMKPSDVGNMVLDELMSQGFSPSVITKEFSFEFMMQVVNSFGLDAEEYKTWFEEFYGAIQEAAAGDGTVGGEEQTLN